jgi:hypothetical protein
MKIKLFVIQTILVFFITSASFAATRIAYYKMDGDLTDETGNDIVDWVNYSDGTPGEDFITWYSGVNCYDGGCARSDHGSADGTDGDLTGVIDHTWLTAEGISTIYIRYRLYIESAYPTFSNFKLVRSDTPYLEMSIKDYLSGGFDTVLNTHSGYGWLEGTAEVANPKWETETVRGNWHLIEIKYTIHATDGTAWIKINGIEGTGTSRDIYTEGGYRSEGTTWGEFLKSPAIKASGDGGWWRIDEYEIWDGDPDPDTTPSQSGVTMSGVTIGQ